MASHFQIFLHVFLTILFQCYFNHILHLPAPFKLDQALGSLCCNHNTVPWQCSAVILGIVPLLFCFGHISVSYHQKFSASAVNQHV